MLSRIEAIYLRILRVVILIAATVALFVAGFAVVTVTPFFLDQIGFSKELDGGDLGSFIQESRINEGISETEDYEGDTQESRIVPVALQRSAKHFIEYTKKHHNDGYEQLFVERLMLDWQEQYPVEHHKDYEVSLEKLTKQLQNSRGKPLTLEQLDQLFIWHNVNFQTSLDEQEVAKSEELVSVVKAFGIAGGAFLTFIFLVFSFLFVRIERNLRVVHFVNVSAENEEEQKDI